MNGALPDFLISMEDADYIHEVLQRNGHQDKGQNPLEWLQWTRQGKMKKLAKRAIEWEVQYCNSNQQPVKPFRSQFQYNNLGYELAGHVIEKVTGQRWDRVLRAKILEPLGLSRTSAVAEEENDNIAKAYTVLENGTPNEIDGVKAAGDTFGGANGGIRSCVKDLLILYRMIMKSGNDQFNTGGASTPGSPLKHVGQLLSSKISLKETSLRESSYALSWVRSQLPNSMGAVGLNQKWMPNGMPTVGKGIASRLVVYHQGSLPGALAAVNLLPESQSAIVVLTNTLALNDCADWVGQLILETLLDVNDKNDYSSIAKESVANALAWHSSVEADLKKDQVPGTFPRDLQAYIGTYINSIQTIKIVVTEANSTLFFALQGLDSERFKVTHHQDDVFTWPRSRNELAERGRFTHQEAVYYKIQFHLIDGHIDQLTWTHDTDVPGGETIFRERQGKDLVKS